jgi:gamma-glutamyl-gamma-aminobutyrate hydrolase PuuD
MAGVTMSCLPEEGRISLILFLPNKRQWHPAPLGIAFIWSNQALARKEEWRVVSSGSALKSMLDYDLYNRLAMMVQAVTLSKAETEEEHPVRPLIGVPTPARESEHGPIFRADAVGAWAAERTEGSTLLMPVWPLPPAVPLFQTLWPQLLRFDGLLLSAHVHTEQECWYRHWQDASEQMAAQRWVIDGELALVQLAILLGMPILALGDGAEKLNVALGGQLLQEAEPRKKSRRSAVPTPNLWPRRALMIRKHTRLAAIFDNQQLSVGVPSTPQQAIEYLGQGLRRSADAEDGSVVAFERADRFFAMGFLGRIDWMLEQCAPVFESFIEACQQYAHIRRQMDLESMRQEICTYLTQQVEAEHPLLPPIQSAVKPRKRSAPSDAMALSAIQHAENGQEMSELAGVTMFASLPVAESSSISSTKSSTLKRREHVPSPEEMKRHRKQQISRTRERS